MPLSGGPLPTGTKGGVRLCRMLTPIDNTYILLAVLPPNSAAAQAIASGNVIIVKMTDNPRLPNPPIPLSTLQSQVATLVAAHTKVKTSGRGAAAERNLALTELRQSLRRTRDYVQVVIEASPTEALAIAQSAGMSLKKRSKREKPALSARWGRTLGLIVLKAKAAKGKAFYDWEVSTDQKTWTRLPSTTRATTKVEGLASGTLYYFRVRSTKNDGPADWCDAVSLMAK